MTNNYSKEDRTARIEKRGSWFVVEHTEHNGIMVYSKSFPERKMATAFCKSWVDRKEAA
jgi:hypothetical protein